MSRQGAYIHFGQTRPFAPVVTQNGQRGIIIHYGQATKFAPIISKDGREGIMDYVPDVSNSFGRPVVQKFVPLTTEGNLIYS